MIYFIAQGDKYVKVGIASDPEERLKVLQIGNPYKLRLMVAFPGGKEEEAWLHKQLGCCRLRGEWFRITDGLILVLAEWIKCKDFKEFSERVADWQYYYPEDDT